MFEGVHNSPYSESIADFGAKRVLNMSGSITDYINNGKTNFKENKTKDTFELKNKKTQKIKEFSGYAAVFAGLAALAVAVKKGKINPSEIVNKIKEIKPSEYISKLKEKINSSKFMDSAKTKFNGLKQKVSENSKKENKVINSVKESLKSVKTKFSKAQNVEETAAKVEKLRPEDVEIVDKIPQ